MTERDIVLSMRQVSLTLGSGENRTDALVDIDLDVAAGELVAVTGRSGSGKSSMLNVAGGLVDATGGVVSVEGADLAARNRRQKAALRRRQIGVVFQDLNLLPTLTAAENVSLPLELDGMGIREARQAALTALADVDVGDLADRYPDEMSGGQRQRIAVARGFVGGRRLLLADEPTGALDEVTAEAVMRLLRQRCNDGAAVLLVTHESSQAAWADRVIRLRDGRIDSVSERSASPPDFATAVGDG
ncbi:MAG: ABC transporter ATP-binding protein [Actinomycetota bacterium]